MSLSSLSINKKHLPRALPSWYNHASPDYKSHSCSLFIWGQPETFHAAWANQDHPHPCPSGQLCHKKPHAHPTPNNRTFNPRAHNLSLLSPQHRQAPRSSLSISGGRDPR